MVTWLPQGHFCLPAGRLEGENKRFPDRWSWALPGPFLWLPALPLSWLAVAPLVCAGPVCWTVPSPSAEHCWAEGSLQLSQGITEWLPEGNVYQLWGWIWVHLGRCGVGSAQFTVHASLQVAFYCKFGGSHAEQELFSCIFKGGEHWDDDHVAGGLCLLDL